jgi:hypothetical protein
MCNSVLSYTSTYAKKKTGIQLHKHWYEHVLRPAETSHESKVTILRNQQVQTIRSIPKNKPDIIHCDNEKGMCMPVDAAVSRGIKIPKRFLNIKTLQ